MLELERKELANTNSVDVIHMVRRSIEILLSIKQDEEEVSKSTEGRSLPRLGEDLPMDLYEEDGYSTMRS